MGEYFEGTVLVENGIGLLKRKRKNNNTLDIISISIEEAMYLQDQLNKTIEDYRVNEKRKEMMGE